MILRRGAANPRSGTAALINAQSTTQLVLLVAAIVGTLLVLSGFGGGLESELSVWRNGLHPRAASGNVALVEIDAKSLGELDCWPWPRSLHAGAIDALSNAGAATVAFDVDFSAKSEPAQDAELSRAITRSRAPVVLATFRQG